MAWAWLPETVHRAHAGTGNPLRYLPELLARPLVRRVLVIDFAFWLSFAIFQTTFTLFTAARFGFDATRTGYYFAGFGLLGASLGLALGAAGGFALRSPPRALRAGLVGLALGGALEAALTFAVLPWYYRGKDLDRPC